MFERFETEHPSSSDTQSLIMVVSWNNLLRLFEHFMSLSRYSMAIKIFQAIDRNGAREKTEITRMKMIQCAAWPPPNSIIFFGPTCKQQIQRILVQIWLIHHFIGMHQMEYKYSSYCLNCACTQLKQFSFIGIDAWIVFRWFHECNLKFDFDRVNNIPWIFELILNGARRNNILDHVLIIFISRLNLNLAFHFLIWPNIILNGTKKSKANPKQRMNIQLFAQKINVWEI